MIFDNAILRFYTRYQTMNTSEINLSQKSFSVKMNNKHPYTDTNDIMNHTEDNQQPDTRHAYVSSAVHVYDTLIAEGVALTRLGGTRVQIARSTATRYDQLQSNHNRGTEMTEAEIAEILHPAQDIR
jgi:plasmid stabilization system protein ParE